MKYIMSLAVIVTGVTITIKRKSIYDWYCWKFHKHYWNGGNYMTCVDCHPHRKLATPISNMNKLEPDVHVPYWVKETK